jgi:DNA polymerase III delta' subunit
MLRRGLERGRLPHAMLFCGPEAVGKRLLARHLAAALNCQVNRLEGGCGQCKNCRLILKDQHPDVITFEPDGQYIKIEQVRELIQEASSMPFHAETKVFILEKAHAMQAPAANALLKILEEPPPLSKLILISHQPDTLLPTIRSRCQLFRFPPLHAEDIALILQKEEIALILKKKNPFSPEEAKERALRSEGNMAAALGLDLEVQKTLEDSVSRFLELVVQGASFGQATELLAPAAKEVDLTKEWLLQLFHSLRDQVIAQACGKASLPLSLSQWTEMARAADGVQRGLGHNINRPLALENLFLTCRKIAGKPAGL